MKYCKCKSGLVLVNLEEGKGECPICKLPKKLGKGLKKMSKIYNDVFLVTGEQDIIKDCLDRARRARRWQT
ncbi:hypothetical protein LCGC14_1805640 [marine sediment metagenome]|uniref:Uncharacterized protein n=1 Tax=marine sediment metagenome TaxID=412755 RepID=A0A0F9HB75_9ZZZZ